MRMVTQAYRFELDPNNATRSALASHVGAARFVFNWGLAEVESRLGARKVLFALARTAAGVDVGVTHLAVLSTGEMVPNPKPLSKYQRRIARLQRERARRRGPTAGQRPSERWQRSQVGVARMHRKVAQARVDGLHKTTTALVTRHGTLVVEDLNVAGLTASAKASGGRRSKAALNRAILDAAPGELRSQLAYKCAWYGSKLVEADRWYPSSKICSGCRTVKAKLSLTQRFYCCEHCGLVLDQDLNAAINLASLVESAGTASGAGTGRNPVPANAQGEERFMPTGRCSSLNCEDGTGLTRSDKTVTAAEQSTAGKSVRSHACSTATDATRRAS